MVTQSELLIRQSLMTPLVDLMPFVASMLGMEMGEL